MNPIAATLYEPTQSPSRRADPMGERVYSLIVADVRDGGIVALAQAHIYATATRVHCLLNVAGLHGRGSAGGGGYHKPSAALDHAMTRAGIALNRELSGDVDMRAALLAAARAVGECSPLATVLEV